MKTRLILQAVVDMSRWVTTGRPPWWAFWKRDRQAVNPVQTLQLVLDIDSRSENDREIIRALSVLADKRVLPRLYEQFGPLRSLDVGEWGGGPVRDEEYVDAADRISRAAGRREIVTEREKRLERLLNRAYWLLPADSEGDALLQQITEELYR